jgi:hypothetical protein
MTHPESSNDLAKAWDDLGSLVDFAYEQGFHELGYNPENVIEREIQRLHGELEAAEQHVKILRESVAAHEPGADYEEEVAAAREALAEFNSESLAVMARRAAAEIGLLRRGMTYQGTALADADKEITALRERSVYALAEKRTAQPPRAVDQKTCEHEWTDVARCLVCDLTYDMYEPAEGPDCVCDHETPCPHPSVCNAPTKGAAT